MPKIKNKLIILPILLFISIGCCGVAAQETRTIDGEYKGKNSTFYYSRSKSYNGMTIWNKNNKLFKEPMIYPKGKMVGPNYLLIDTRANVSGDPFSRRFPGESWSQAYEAGLKVMNEINSHAITPNKLKEFQDRHVSLGITYYFSPDGIIREIEFYKKQDVDITGEELEILEKEIKTRLMYVTQSSDYKGGNYIKASSGWPFALH